MTFAKKTSGWVLAAGAALALGGTAEAGLIKSAGSASTSNKGTVGTTAGQTQILATIDPYNVVKFQLDYSFESDRVDFVSIQGLNGYIIDSYTLVLPPTGNQGLISNIQGHYPGFEFAPGPVPVTFDSGECEHEFITPPSPAGEVDMFSILFNIKKPNLPLLLTVFAGDESDFMTGYDPATGNYTVAAGPNGVDSTALRVPANAPNGPVGGPSGVPLPAAVWMGLIAGGAILTKARRRVVAA